MIYLDWAATALPDKEILNIIREAELEYCGNPSSIHCFGRKAQKLLERSRSMVAKALNCSSDEIVFTSGGTESNNMLLLSMLSRFLRRQLSEKNIIISGIEHPSVYEPANVLKQNGFKIITVKAGINGIIDPDKVAEKLDKNTILVSVMMVNNETGALQPISEIGDILGLFAKRTGLKAHFHVDAVQAFGKIPFCPYDMHVDSASISAHKLGGPKGIGALFLRKGTNCEFLYKGGSQEKGRRPGTENLSGAFGLGLTAEKSMVEIKKNLDMSFELMNLMIKELKKSGEIVFIPESRSEMSMDLFSPYILKVAVPPVPGEVLVRMFEEKKILVSTGSACSSKKQKGKYRVLDNMGIPENLSSSSIRISIGSATNKDDIVCLVSAFNQIISDLKQSNLLKG